MKLEKLNVTSGVRLLVCFLVAIFFVAVPAFGQSNPNEEQGMKPYDSWHGGDLDSVSMTNGGLVLHIPLLSYPQRGNLDLSFTAYFNTKQWTAFVNPVECANQSDPNGCTPQWTTFQNGASNELGKSSLTGVYVASSLGWSVVNTCTSTPGDPDNGILPTYNWSASAFGPDGSSHSFGSGFSTTNCPTDPGPFRSLDGSGFALTGPNTVIMPNGTEFNLNPNIPSAVMTDTNGNHISTDSSGAYTDTLGRVIQHLPFTTTTDVSNCPNGTASAAAWSVPGLAGGTRTFKFCYSNVNIFTNFGQSGITEFGNPNTLLLTAIVLPDLTMWTFSYDHYGDVTRLGFPTGGSISYTYVVSQTTCGDGTPVSMIVTSRTLDANDGAGGHTWNYNYSVTGNSGTMVVTSPDGNDAVHTITNIGGSGMGPGGGCSFFETKTQSYQGSRNGGTLLKTKETQYSTLIVGAMPTSTTITLPGGLTSKVVNTWDSGNTVTIYEHPIPVVLGSLLQKDEYDFSNTLVRSTLNQYLWQDNVAYLNNNLLGLIVSSTVNDGAGHRVAQSTHGYDQYAQGQPVASGITTGLGTPPAGGTIRGNQTTSSRWLDTTNAFVSSTATYFDTGMKASSADPLGHVTNFAYSSAFQGAYMTQTNSPDTQMPDAGASIVHHVVSGNYDFNTGLLTRFTDENGNNYTYQYDAQKLWMTQANHPDGGLTKFIYPDPNTVERQRLITGSSYDDFKAKFDGLGRPYQTQQLTPDCSSYIKVDTTYDSVGRTATVSNPYCLTSEPTYGITQNHYDALGRTTQTIKPDGSASSTAFNQSAALLQNVDCTVGTDEAGKQRKTCSDGLGRLVEVDEPNPLGAPAQAAKGSVTVSGGEQGGAVPGAAGSVILTLSGLERKVLKCDTCRTLIYDSGTLSLTINGQAIPGVPYSGSSLSVSTVSGLASALATAINSNSSYAQVPANGVVLNNTTPPSATITLTARTLGAVTNYSFNASSSTNNPSTFTGASFNFSPTSGNFSGGNDAINTTDTGVVRITINGGTPYQYTFGANDNTGTIATGLANAMQNDPLVTATPSGGTVNLTSKIAGTSGNAYTIAASYTTSGNFPQPSFTTSTSGATLAGGLDAGAINNNPLVTTYQYNIRGELLCAHQKGTDTSADKACTDSTVPAAWRPRNFSYDSLGRLLTTRNPESGLISYQYDLDNQLISKIAPGPNQTGTATVTTTYTYDTLNRISQKTYSDGTTLPAAFLYDLATYNSINISNPIGRLVHVTNNSNAASTFSFDTMGRIIHQSNCLPANCSDTAFPVDAAYDLVGNLLSMSNGVGVTTFYQYDTAGRPTSVTSNMSDPAHPGTLATVDPAVGYSSFGAFRKITLGNGLTETAAFNNRLQPCRINVNSSGTILAGCADQMPSGNLQDFTYGTNWGASDNGNIASMSAVGVQNFNRAYGYDQLNRLLTYSAPGDACSGLAWTYDAWGNRMNQSVTGGTCNTSSATVNAQNQLVGGYQYDAAGNLINDGTHTYTYDAENRLIQVDGGNTATYIYDAMGRRVEKAIPGRKTDYVFDISGKPTTEWLVTSGFTGWSVGYVYLGNRLLAQYRDATTYFVHRDHLGSTRILTKLDKTAFDSIDFLPFGEQIAGGAGTTHKFTDKERDPESGLDYFGARYYSSAMGRFATPDWADKPTTVPYSELSDPQSLNLYSYVRNRPTAFVDDDGHDDVAAPSCGGTNKCTETVVPDTPTSQDGVDSLGNPTLVVTNSETVQTTTMNNDGTSTVEWARVTTTVTIGSDGSETATQQVTGKYTATFDSSGTPLSVSAPQSGDVKAISPQEANKSFPGGFDRAVGVAGAAKQLREARENARRTEDIKKTVREEGKSGREHLTWETIAHIVISTCIEFCRW